MSDLEVIYIFLTNKYSLNKLGYKYLNDKVDNHGNKAKRLLDKYEVKNNRKGVLLTKTLDEEINDASGIYKDTLLKIKDMIDNNKMNSSHIVDDQLKDKLFIEIFERIHKLASQMTNNDPRHEANDYLIDIVFKRRKKVESHWYLNVLDFIKANLKDYLYLIDNLNNLVKETLKIDDNKSHDENVKESIKMLLDLVIGTNYGNNEICRKAIIYKEELNRAIIIRVLLGEYRDNLLKQVNKKRLYKDDFNVEQMEKSIIVLYLKNLEDDAKDNGYNYLDKVYSVLAHEYFHFYHYYQYFLAKKDGYRIQSSDLNKYNPGSIVKESLASFFEGTYSMDKGYKLIVQNLYDAWNQNSYEFWPYAGAIYFVNKNYKFLNVFIESITNLKNALNELIK